MKAGKPVTVEVENATDTPELVHWHGFLIPSDARRRRRTGHSLHPAAERRNSRPRQLHLHPRPRRLALVSLPRHGLSATCIKAATPASSASSWSTSGNDPGQYDQEVFLALRDWEPFYTRTMEDDDDEDPSERHARETRGPQHRPERPRGQLHHLLHQRQIARRRRAHPRQAGRPRPHPHFLNASAIENRRISLSAATSSRSSHSTAIPSPTPPSPKPSSSAPANASTPSSR